MRSPLFAFVGEAPGKNEAIKGQPFVGMAGQVIKGILKYLGVSEREVYFTNTCLCRPPDNRTPTLSEVRNCFPRLQQELERVQPQYVVALGATAGRALIPNFRGLHVARGRVQTTKVGFSGLVTYHPAAILYPAGEKMFPVLMSDIERLFMYATGGKFPYEELSTQAVIVDSIPKMTRLLYRLTDEDIKSILYDWETTGLDPRTNEGFCLGMSWKPGTGVVIPQNILGRFLPQLRERLSDKDLGAFNSMFDCKWNEKYGLPSDIGFDPMLAHYTMDERPQERNLELLSEQFCNAPRYEAEMLQEYNTTKSSFIRDVPAEVIYNYCAQDVDYGLRLANIQHYRMKDDKPLQKLYYEILLPGARAFADIEQNGVWVNKQKLLEVTELYKTKVTDNIENLKSMTGDSKFNPNSHPQVQEHLWDVLCLKEPKLYGRNKRSADKETREALLEEYPDNDFIKVLHQYKTDQTLYSRYLRGLPKFLDKDDRIRCSYHLDRTETGRLSATNPAIHQIPRESGIRSVFGVPEGYTLLAGDYSQVEMRMAAHIAGDYNLADALEAEDFHKKMASEAFGVPYTEVTKQQRQAAKVVSFGLLYQMSDKGLSSETGLSMKETKEFTKAYAELMPQVQQWIKRTKLQVKTQQYVESIFGRRRRFPLITRRNLDSLYREAVNFPVQSAASDLTLLSIIELNRIFKNDFRDVKIVIMVHDSIIVECPDYQVQEVGKIMLDIMTDTPFETFVKFPVELKAGRYWGQGELLEVV